jgi:hypothetical protein
VQVSFEVLHALGPVTLNATSHVAVIDAVISELFG